MVRDGSDSSLWRSWTCGISITKAQTRGWAEEAQPQTPNAETPSIGYLSENSVISINCTMSQNLAKELFLSFEDWFPF